MVYVFGIEGVPVFEMLFVIMILMLFGLLFILLEIRKLRKLIIEENADLKRFEQDLAEFEHDQGKTPSKALLDYVRNAQGKGISNDEIGASLKKAGWDEHEVNTILNKIKQ